MKLNKQYTVAVLSFLSFFGLSFPARVWIQLLFDSQLNYFGLIMGTFFQALIFIAFISWGIRTERRKKLLKGTAINPGVLYHKTWNNAFLGSIFTAGILSSLVIVLLLSFGIGYSRPGLYSLATLCLAVPVYLLIRKRLAFLFGPEVEIPTA